MRPGSALLLLLAALGTPAGGPVPRLRVEVGAARVASGPEVRALDPRTGEVELGAGAAWVESGARSRLALHWRGAASAVVEGPAALETGPERLLLSSFQVAEIEVRRGRLALELAGLGRAELAPGALRLRVLPGGVVELLNRGGAALELSREGEKPLRIPAGERQRVRMAP